MLRDSRSFTSCPEFSMLVSQLLVRQYADSPICVILVDCSYECAATSSCAGMARTLSAHLILLPPKRTCPLVESVKSNSKNQNILVRLGRDHLTWSRLQGRAAAHSRIRAVFHPEVKSWLLPTSSSTGSASFPRRKLPTGMHFISCLYVHCIHRG